MRFLPLLLAMLALSAARGGCDGSVWLLVPAVLGNEGGLVNASMSLAPGHGDTYVNVFPRTGTNTQESIELAVAYARARTGTESTCDVLVGFGSQAGAGYIEGPSGGTALAVASYALLTGQEPRHDTIITGALDRTGKVTPVGGLYEKARSAAASGARYFITPVENLYELLLLKKVEDRYGISVLQAGSVEEVIGFMLENRSINQSALAPQKRQAPDLPPYDGSGIAAFLPVARGMIELENETLGTVPAASNESGVVRDFFSAEVLRQQAMAGRGYVFSAANEAFLDYIDISTIKVLMAGEADLPRKKGDVGKCVSSLPRPNLTARNFEWVVGADLRKAWAYDRYNNTAIDGKLLEEEKFTKYNELMYGDAWCNVAKTLLAAAPSGGTPLDENAWQGLAEERLTEARALEPKDNDLVSRLNIAQASYGKGRYGAAIYDAAYVISGAESAARKAGGNETGALVAGKRATLWADVYQSHAAFLYAQNETDAAYRTARFAEELENATLEMERLGRPVQEGQDRPAEGNGSAQQGAGTALPWYAALGWGGWPEMAPAAALILLFILIIAIILWSRRANGNNGKRTGRAHRAEQKKGRA